MSNFAVILLAAGQSSRFKDREKKPFASLDGRAVWLRSLELFSVREDVSQILIVIAEEDQELFERRFRANVAFISNARVVLGGKERSDSVQNALAHTSASAELVAIHDTARPCVTRDMIDHVFRQGASTGAAILATPIADTLKRSKDGTTISETVPRQGLWAAQTPQVFRRSLLMDAYARRSTLGGPFTDDAQLVEAFGHPVALVPCDATNMKITSRSDLALAEAIIKSRPKPRDNRFHPFADEQMWR